MKTKMLFIFVTLVLMCSGCQWSCKNLGLFCPDTITNKPEVNTLKDIVEARKIVKESSDTIEKASGEIATEANKINELV